MTYQKEQERWTEITTQRTARLRNLAGLTLSKAGWESHDIASILGMSFTDVERLIEYSKLPIRMGALPTHPREKQLIPLSDLKAAIPRKTRKIKRRAKRRRKS